MKLSAAIAMSRNSTVGLQPTLASLKEHGFEEVLFLLLSENPDALTSDVKKLQGEGHLQVSRVHPDFVVEAALHEATGDWVFVFYPGETLDLLGSRLPDALSGHDARSTISLGGEVRGFRRNAVTNGGLVQIDAPKLLTTDRIDEPWVKPVWKPSIPLTVVLPTWRLGGLDVTLGALAKQTFKNFEVILVDALYRWRAGGIEGQLKALPFEVHHVPVDNSIFPVSSHSRFRNTAIRRANGERLVFFSDYACPPPNFLAAHVGLPTNQVAISPWVRTTINPESLAVTGYVPPDTNQYVSRLTVWDVIEHAQRDEFLWSTFKPGIDPLNAALEYELANELKPPKFPRLVSEHERMSTKEYIGHWKADSVSTELVRLVNGWDESFDGSGPYSDVDFSLRLIWAGAEPKVIEPEVRILDAHAISIAPITDTTKSNYRRLAEVRERRAIRCVHGLVRGIVHD